MNYCNFSSSLGCSENKQIKKKSNTFKGNCLELLFFTLILLDKKRIYLWKFVIKRPKTNQWRIGIKDGCNHFPILWLSLYSKAEFFYIFDWIWVIWSYFVGCGQVQILDSLLVSRKFWPLSLCIFSNELLSNSNVSQTVDAHIFWGEKNSSY